MSRNRYEGSSGSHDVSKDQAPARCPSHRITNALPGGSRVSGFFASLGTLRQAIRFASLRARMARPKIGDRSKTLGGNVMRRLAPALAALALTTAAFAQTVWQTTTADNIATIEMP